jgi:hypothetical protein
VSKESRLRALDNQVRRLQRRLDRLDQVSDRYSWLRAILVLIALVATGLTYYFLGVWPAALSAGLGALAFAGAVYAHRRVERAVACHRLWMQNKQAQIARATLDWDRIPVGATYRPRPEHPFESDLDLVGPRSLHLLLDTAVSHEGSQRLRDWLAAPVPDQEQSQRRQAVVRELAPMHTFRDRLVLHGYGGRVSAYSTGRGGGDPATGGLRHTWRARALADWLAQAPEDGGASGVLSARRWLLLLTGLAALKASLLAAYLRCSRWRCGGSAPRPRQAAAQGTLRGTRPCRCGLPWAGWAPCFDS